MTIRRWRRPGVSDLPVWNLPVDGGLLWERLGAPAADSLRRAGMAEGEIGRDLAASTADAILRLRARFAFERAYVGGGLTLAEGFARELRSLDADVTVDPNGRFLGEQGGLALLGERGRPRTAVVDVGQTGIKCALGGRRLVFERDLRQLPLELIDAGGRPPRPSSTRREAAAAFIGGAIAALANGDGGADALVLALPCPLDDACVPGPCSYGWEGEARLLPAILERSGARFQEVLVLNDAELAAETALARRQPIGAGLLVLTLGFGPGAALVLLP